MGESQKYNDTDFKDVKDFVLIQCRRFQEQNAFDKTFFVGIDLPEDISKDRLKKT